MFNLHAMFGLVLALIMFQGSQALAIDLNDVDAALSQAVRAAVQQDKLVAADGVADDLFGYTVAIDGDWALVGANLHGLGGAAYMYRWDGSDWQFAQKLTASDAGSSDYFGASVSVSGQRALIGAPLDNAPAGDSGSAYVFVYNGSAWVEDDKLTASDGGSGDYFGQVVSLRGDRALISAYKDDDAGNDAGAAYVFDFNGSDWVQSQKLTAQDGGGNHAFGFSLNLSDDRALVGAFLYNDGSNTTGAAYVYDFDGVNWNETQKLVAEDAAHNSYFGWSVSVSGDRALIGAQRDQGNTSFSGSAYVFALDGGVWSQQQKLTAADMPSGGQFGAAVSLSGTRALIGARRDNDNGPSSGSVYVYEFNGAGWAQADKFVADDGASSDEFGVAVDQSADRILVGAFKDDDGSGRAGSAYVFSAPFRVLLNVSGLDPGQSLSLLNNGVDALLINDNGPAAFAMEWPSGAAWNVTISSQPTQPRRTCQMDHPSGVIANQPVLIEMTCPINQYAVKVDVSGLAAGNSVEFFDGMGAALVSTNGLHTVYNYDDGSAFDLSVLTQPTTPNQLCAFSGAHSGTLNGNDVQLTVHCVTEQYMIGGGVSGLAPGNQVVLQNNGGNDLTVGVNGAFAFSAPLDDGSAFNVTVLSQPSAPNQTCSVDNGSGQLNGGDHIAVVVTCVTNSYFIAGEVTGLWANNFMVLQNNGGDDRVVTGSGAFVFATPLQDGASYSVSILLQPDDPIQPCTVFSGSGTVSGVDVDNVLVQCEPGDDLIFREGHDGVD